MNGALEGRRVQIVVSVEQVLLAVLICAVVGLRWVELGQPPLSDPEARQAFAALHTLAPQSTAAQGEITSPLVYLGALLSFGAAGASDAAARFFPMLAGVLLAFSPLLLRKALGHSAALIAVLWLTLSPTAVVMSRSVAGHTFEALGIIGLLICLLMFFSEGRSIRMAALAGAALGFGVLGGYGSLVHLIAFALGALAAVLLSGDIAVSLKDELRNFAWGGFASGLAGALFIFGTAFFAAPGSFQAVAEAFGLFVRGFAVPQPQAPYLGYVLLLYEAGLIIFGLLGLAGAWQSARLFDRIIAGWGAAALLLALIYPGALPGHALWVVLPFSLLAGSALSRLFDAVEEGVPAWVTPTHALSIMAVAAMVTMALRQHISRPSTFTVPLGADAEMAWFSGSTELVFAALLLLVIPVLLFFFAGMFGVGAAWRGLLWGGALTALITAAGQSGYQAFTEPSNPFALLRPAAVQPTFRVLRQTIEDASRVAAGNPVEAAVTLDVVPDGAVAWALRDFPNVRFVPMIDAGVTTPVVVTASQNADVQLGSAYLGQDIAVTQLWKPSQLTRADILKWVVFRETTGSPPVQPVIIWIREDIYRLAPETGP